MDGRTTAGTTGPEPALSGPGPTSADVRTGRRLEGIDVARALALGGMLMAHYAQSSRTGEPGWLQVLDNAVDGRAAPLFAILLGVGAGILSTKSGADRSLVRRGLVLLVVGLAIWPWTDEVYLILPHYGVLLVAVPLFRRLPSRWLLAGAVALFAVPSVVTALVDQHALRASNQPDSFGAMTDVGFMVRHLVWTGGYPIVGWAGFVLIGLWVARQPLAERATQVRLVVVGSLVAVLQPASVVAFEALGGTRQSSDAAGWAAFFDSTAHSNLLAWYLLASASAVAVLGMCLLAAPRARRALHPLTMLGQLALTAYLAHLAFGELVVFPWQERSRPPLNIQMAVALVAFVALALAAVAWRRRWKRGPLEGAVRALAG